MTFAEIEQLLEKGFTPQQITELQNKPQTDSQSEPQTQTQTQTQTQSEDIPSWASALTDTIKGLQRSIQAQALAGAQQQRPQDVDERAHDVLASIIAPTLKKEDK